METLKPCPWCNKVPILMHYDSINKYLTLGKPWFIECTWTRCAVKPMTGYYRLKSSCINGWNRRAKETTNGN